MKKFSPKYVVGLAREMRRDMTEAEDILWRRLKSGGLDGLRFRKQHPIGRYIVDFYCDEYKLIVEVDGAVHDKSKEYDSNRDAFLEGNGYTVLRVSNDDVMNDIEAAFGKIRLNTR